METDKPTGIWQEARSNLVEVAKGLATAILFVVAGVVGLWLWWVAAVLRLLRFLLPIALVAIVATIIAAVIFA